MYGHVFTAVKCIKKIEHRRTVVGIDEILSSFVSSSFRFSLFGKRTVQLNLIHKQTKNDQLTYMATRSSIVHVYI